MITKKTNQAHSKVSSDTGVKFIIFPLLVFLFLIPAFHRNPFYLHILIIMALNIIIAAALRLQLITGRINIGIMAFCAIGAYTSALLALKFGINFWLSSLVGMALAGVVALGLGGFVLRVNGVYFAILTMCLLEMLRYFLTWYRELTRGSRGLTDIPGPTIGGYSFGVNQVPYYYLALTVTLVSIWIMYRVERSRAGMAFHAVGQSDLLSAHLGINLTKYRILAFIISSSFAALAGAIAAHYMHYTSPGDFTLTQSFIILIFMVVGGQGSPVGPIVGTVLLSLLSEVLRSTKEILPLVYGAILVLMVMFCPGGIVELPRTISQWRSMRVKLRLESRVSPDKN